MAHSENEYKDYEEQLNHLQQDALSYFLTQMNPVTGLIADNNKPGSPASISATGMGVSCFICAAEKGFMTREEALDRILLVMRFLRNTEQSKSEKASGYKGFYYHFLDMETGERFWNCELSTIDTAIMIAGILSAVHYFTGEEEKEKEVCELALELYERIDWQWATNGKNYISHGWKPRTGFLKYNWDKGFSEAHILYILAMGAPKHSISGELYKTWIETFEVKTIYDRKYFYAGPLFIYQMSHLWVHFDGIRDKRNREENLDYFENSKQATCVQQSYAIENPHNFSGYHSLCWGITASDGPGPSHRTINDKKIKFYDYKARGVPYGPDDGTISPWAVIASLPFVPALVLETIQAELDVMKSFNKKGKAIYASFNPTWKNKKQLNKGWVSEYQFGINQGPIIIMIQNFQSQLIWNLLKVCPAIEQGLLKGGFEGGWLQEK